MKAQTKALVASVVVIALALSAVSGITYSWFTDSEKAEIDITTGTLKIEVTTSDLVFNKITNDGKIEVNVDHVFTAEAIDQDDSVKVTIGNFAPGDQLVVPVKIQNIGSLKAQIKVSMTSDDSNGYIDCKMAGLAEDAELNEYETYDSEEYVVGTANGFGTLTISMFPSVGNVAQGQNITIVLEADAIQMNAPSTDEVSGQTLSSGSVVSVQPTESDASYIGVQLTDASTQITEVTVKAVSAKADGSYTISTSGATTTILGGVQVTSTNSGSQTSLSTAKATLTYVFDGNLSEVDLYATHVSSSGGEETSTKIDAGNIKYDSSTGKTTVTISANGFSTWFVSADANAIVNGAFTKANSAVDLFTNGGSIILLSDFGDVPSTITVSKNTVLNLNGHTISTNTVGCLIDVKSNLSVFDGELKNTYAENELDQEKDARVIQLTGLTTDVALQLEDTDVIGPETFSYSSGIIAYKNTGKISIEIDGGTIHTDHYALNLYLDNAEIECDVRNATIQGYGAIKVFSKAEVTLTQCTVIGLNKWDGTGSDFGAITIGQKQENAKGTTLSMKDCEIKTVKEGTSKEWLFRVRSAEYVITLDNCSLNSNGTGITVDQMIENQKEADEYSWFNVAPTKTESDNKITLTNSQTS